jgi:hypothetical protein
MSSGDIGIEEEGKEEERSAAGRVGLRYWAQVSDCLHNLEIDDDIRNTY